MSTKAALPTPKPICQLPSQVVNKIAAGEIIQRPANALKELIENALDAGATTIRVTVKEGGTKLLQIQDNGSGIRKADLPILCERFTTSKIKAFEDLSALGTYGFRGEALASISHVAHLTVTTKTRAEACAWKAAYSDGVMIPVKAGGDAEPVPCAGNDGTLLVVEDLFFNTPTRLKSLRSSSDEYSRILTVMTHYSIHNSGISFVCKKAASPNADVSTSLGASVLDNIGAHYGEAVRRELVEVEVESLGLGMKAEGWFSGANYGGKKGTFLFFINHRLVDCTPLKRAFEAFYAALLPKGAHPFVYLALTIDPAKVDVNVHPTKREVGFEDDEEIVEAVCAALGKRLEGAGESRSFKVQTLLPGARPVGDTPKPLRTQSRDSTGGTQTPVATGSNSKSSGGSGSTARKVAPNKLVRTDHHAQTLDDMMFPLASGVAQTLAAADGDEDGDEGREGLFVKRRKTDHDLDFESLLAKENAGAAGSRARIPQSECMLRSVRELRQEVLERCHKDLEAVVKNHIFVGVADLNGALSMLQYQTKLYLVNHASLSEELFYQLGLRQFGRLGRIQLRPAPSLRDLIRLAVEHEEGREAAKMSADEIVDRIYKTIMRSRAMVDEYFSLTITDKGVIDSLPHVLPGYTPNLNKLPLFLVRIGVQVDWQDEKACFDSFLRELAFFYVPGPAFSRSSSNETSAGLTIENKAREESKQIQHVIFPAAKTYLLPPEKMLRRDFVQVTSLESLYKVASFKLASLIAILDLKGKSLIQRSYRDDIPSTSIERFLPLVLEQEEEGAYVTPCFTSQGINYLHIRHNNLYLLALTKKNSNAAELLTFLHKLVSVLTEYFKELEEESIRDNFVIIYELLDEMMDFGYPQTTESKILQEYITQESHKLEVQVRPPMAVTNAVSWRSEGIRYRKNEVFLDVVESVNLLVNANGNVVRSEILGAVKMKCYLSGMPELRLGLNDKVMFESTGRTSRGKAIEMEDVKFHQCVRLSRFENDRTISFIPPDGEFELMSYRLNTQVKPLIWAEASIEQHSGSRIEYVVKVRAQFKRRSTANNVEVYIPVPEDADSPKFRASVGTVHYVPEKSAFVWKIKQLGGGKDYLMRAHFGLPSVRGEEIDKRAPITIKFEIPYFTVSGIQVRYLKIVEKSGYQALPWVRYITQHGDEYALRTNERAKTDERENKARGFH